MSGCIALERSSSRGYSRCEKECVKGMRVCENHCPKKLNYCKIKVKKENESEITTDHGDCENICEIGTICNEHRELILKRLMEEDIKIGGSPGPEFGHEKCHYVKTSIWHRGYDMCGLPCVKGVSYCPKHSAKNVNYCKFGVPKKDDPEVLVDCGKECDDNISIICNEHKELIAKRNS